MVKITSFMALAGVLVTSVAVAEPERFVLDESHLSIGFIVGHAQYAGVLGQFTEAEGEFVYDETNQVLHSGRVVVDAASVFSGHKRRDEHVRNADFLHVDEHPQIVFEATEFRPASANTGELVGELTMLGVTQPLTLDVVINQRAPHPIGGADTLGVSARGALLRSEFGMDYALEGELVGDEVELIIELEAIHDD
ncbi:hypothetical protein GH984_08985 [Spiribacter sp. C176]|uniref:Lipid/polyisoprenoid-binding YceI-like domain-containing protein n=1 Tax=Spiribacter salilacus TaxID=2664894 RepID=A0A6N7QQY6_9GAMM|nr:YceI family protein [Spiribacter salilacus]MRH78841.1 hypothetical protein [Spiribacter salilacus]